MVMYYTFSDTQPKQQQYRKDNMKNKEYKGAANILNNQNIGKQFFDHMDFGDCQSRIDEDIIPKVEIVELPKRYFNKLIKFIKKG